MRPLLAVFSPCAIRAGFLLIGTGHCAWLPCFVKLWGVLKKLHVLTSTPCCKVSLLPLITPSLTFESHWRHVTRPITTQRNKSACCAIQWRIFTNSRIFRDFSRFSGTAAPTCEPLWPRRPWLGTR